MAPLFAAHPFSYADFLHKYVYLTKHILANMTTLLLEHTQKLTRSLCVFISTDVDHLGFNTV